MRKRIWFGAAVVLALLACGGDPNGPDEPLTVDRVELSSTSLTLGPGASQILVATPRAANGAVVPGRTISWNSDANTVATVSMTGEVVGVSLGTGRITASIDGKSAQATVFVIPTAPQHLVAAWRMESFDGHTVPAVYAVFYDDTIGDRIIAKVEIVLDSATKVMTTAARYERRYWFSELHDGVLAFRYMWGDRGSFALGGTVPVPLTLTSEYIENLMTPGSVRTDGRLALNEELWIGETRRATLWVRRPTP